MRHDIVTIDDLLARAMPEPNTGCMLWEGGTNGEYGYVMFRGKKWLAHRVAWTLVNGEIPGGMFVLHRCDTPLCIDPFRDLFIGTKLDNARDRNAKGRQAHGDRSGARLHPESRPRGDAHSQTMKRVAARGERNARTKLSEADVADIRNRRTKGEGLLSIGQSYGVTRQYVGDLVRGDVR